MSQAQLFKGQIDVVERPPNPPPPKIRDEIKNRIRDPAAREALEDLERQLEEYFKQQRVR